MQLPPFPNVSPAVLSQQGGCGAAKRCEGCSFSSCHFEMFVLDLDCWSHVLKLYRCPHKDQHSQLYFEVGGQLGTVWSFLLPAASLHSLPDCCPSVDVAEYIFSECVYVGVCLFALSVRDLSHIVISPAAGYSCWPSFCGLAAGQSPISLCLIIFQSDLFSYLLPVVHVIVNLMVLSWHLLHTWLSLGLSLWIGFTVVNLTISYYVSLLSLHYI